MKPQLLFWIPAALRLSFILVGAAVMWWFAGPYLGIALAVAAMAAVMVVQLYYLYQLSAWLDDPDSKTIPHGWGAWTSVFSRLYKLRRGDEMNRAELSEWLARFRQAMSLLPDGVVIMDDVLFLEWCNPAAERHLGIDYQRDKDRRITNLVRSPAFIDYVVLGRYQQPLTLTMRERKLIVQIIPFESKRQILVTHDVTESERIDMMRRDFVANASHELRTPLTVINGFLEIAVNQPELDAQTRAAHLKLMYEQGRRMQNLVEDMLTLTRLESLDYPMRPERIAMRALLEQVLQEGQALSGGRHAIEFSFDGPDLKGSSEELRSAFGNLVSNAVRYTPEHGTIRISWTMAEGGPQFAVRDTGIGISAEHISRLTERFYRVDKSRSRETQGTGLGLAIVKHVLLRHDATLAIESEAGKGSTFSVRFPRLLAYED
jgi:two-component system phosphate regulon sensor histidine kinase PhoR